MPELPEVETVRRDLESALLGAKIGRVVVSGARSVRRQDAKEFVEQLTGKTLVGFFRHGKYLWFGLDDGQVMVVHLRMSGRLRLMAEDAEKKEHTHVVFSFVDGGELHFVDPRTFGECFVTEVDPSTGRPKELASLGRDATDPELGEALQQVLTSTNRAVKIVLLDQTVIAGLGNIYADEVCALARVRPDRVAKTLQDKERAALIAGITTVLTAATRDRGSSLRDVSYKDLFGRPGCFQARHVVYQRTGSPCQTCQTPIERVVVGGRSAHFCPHCQS